MGEGKNFEELVEGEWYQLGNGAIGQAECNTAEDRMRYPFIIGGRSYTRNGLWNSKEPSTNDVVQRIKPPCIKPVVLKRKKQIKVADWVAVYGAPHTRTWWDTYHCCTEEEVRTYYSCTPACHVFKIPGTDREKEVEVEE